MAAVKATRNDSILFRIPEHKLSKPGFARKRRLIAYNDYKEAIRLLAEAQQFELPVCNFHVKFFFPVSESWSKKKKSQKLNTPHDQKPDIDNLLKPVMDSLLSQKHGKNDTKVWDVRITKMWSEAPRIEVEYEC